MPLIIGANSVSGYEIDNSLRFNSGSSDYLYRVPANVGNRKTFTWSAWVKRGSLVSQVLLQGDALSNSYFVINFDSNNALRIFNNNSGTNNLNLTTTQLFRDSSAWYHILIAIDTTDSTASNRVKLYVNGNQVTSFGTAIYPAQNTDLNGINQTVGHGIGQDIVSLGYFSGYMSEINFINGQALTPSSFGETDTASGIWKPIAYTGAYGTNGFYLKFANSAALGTDSSGNGNTWTVNNLTSIDQTTDTPTNNFATFNPLRYTGVLVNFTEGNLKATALTDANLLFHTAYSSIGVTQGKWYAEFKCVVGGSPANNVLIGGGSFEYAQDSGNQNGNAVGLTTYNGIGSFSVDTVSTTGLTTYAATDIIGVYLNVDNSEISFYKN